MYMWVLYLIAMEAINRQIENKYGTDYDVEVNPLDEGCGMIEITLKDENGEYYYKHLSASEVRDIVLESYE